jgi:dipeptidase D
MKFLAIFVIITSLVLTVICRQQCRANPDAIRGLEPRLLWTQFYAISCIPRCSTKEKNVRDGLLKLFAQSNRYEYKEDAKGNVLITVPAKPGRENAPIVTFQTHLDMVCEKNRGSTHDFERDPIQLIIDQNREWIHANGTSLGSDDGLGVSTVLSIVKEPLSLHGPLELLFTVEEEIGLNGAIALQPDFIKGRTLINVDADNEGELIIGCAGGSNIRQKFPIRWTNVVAGEKYQLKVTGMNGGHSGVDIHKNRANAIKIISRIVLFAAQGLDIQISGFEAGTATNAIPREAFADFFATGSQYETFAARANEIFKQIKEETASVEPNLALSIIAIPAADPKRYITDAINFFKYLSVHQHGVYRWSPDIPNLVETSLNLASLRIVENEIVVLTSVRSSVTSQMTELVNVIKYLVSMSGGVAEVYGGYPGWRPDISSKLLGVAKNVFKRTFSKDVKVSAIHAGLETGVVGSKYPGIDMISCGATTSGPHSPDEKVLISSAPKIQLFLMKLLEELSK